MVDHIALVICVHIILVLILSAMAVLNTYMHTHTHTHMYNHPTGKECGGGTLRAAGSGAGECMGSPQQGIHPGDHSS